MFHVSVITPFHVVLFLDLDNSSMFPNIKYICQASKSQECLPSFQISSISAELSTLKYICLASKYQVYHLPSFQISILSAMLPNFKYICRIPFSLISSMLLLSLPCFLFPTFLPYFHITVYLPCFPVHLHQTVHT